MTIEVLNESRVPSSIELENVSHMILGGGRLLWNLDSKPSGRFDQPCAIQEEKPFYEANGDPWTVLCGHYRLIVTGESFFQIARSMVILT